MNSRGRRTQRRAEERRNRKSRLREWLEIQRARRREEHKIKNDGKKRAP